MTSAPSGRLLKVTDVSVRLAVSRSWVYEAASDGRLPAIRLGGVDGPLRFREDDLERWISEARAAWNPGDALGQTLRRAAKNVAAQD